MCRSRKMNLCCRLYVPTCCTPAPRIKAQRAPGIFSFGLHLFRKLENHTRFTLTAPQCQSRSSFRKYPNFGFTLCLRELCDSVVKLSHEIFTRETSKTTWTPRTSN